MIDGAAVRSTCIRVRILAQLHQCIRVSFHSRRSPDRCQLELNSDQREDKSSEWDPIEPPAHFLTRKEPFLFLNKSHLFLLFLFEQLLPQRLSERGFSSDFSFPFLSWYQFAWQKHVSALGSDGALPEEINVTVV